METLTFNTIDSFLQELEKLDLFLVVKNKELILNGRKGKLSPRDVEMIKQNKEMINYIKENKQALITHLTNLNGAEKHKKINKISSIYELSPLQEGILFHELYDSETTAFIRQYKLSLPGDINPESFEAAWNHLLKCHTILRSSFVSDKLNIPVQCVYNEVRIPFQVLDFSSLTSAKQKNQIEQFLQEDLAKGFDLTKAPLMRLALIKINKDAYEMVWTFHHLILDGWSMPLVFKGVLSAYEAFESGITPVVENVDKYEDYIRHIKSIDEGEIEAFWKNYLEDFQQATLLPFVDSKKDRNKGIGQFKEHKIQLGALSDEIKAFARDKQITINTVFQGVWAFLLAKYSCTDDTLYGVTVSGRPAELPNAENRIGLFINTIPLRTQLDEQTPVKDWLKQIQNGHMQGREYQSAALNKLQNLAGIKGDFFDSILVFENYPDQQENKEEHILPIEKAQAEESSNYLLSVIVELRQQLEVKFKYNSSLLVDEYAQQIANHFIQVLEQLAAGKEKLNEIEYLLSEEREQLIHTFNKPSFEYTDSQTIVEHFETQAQKRPDELALVFGNKQLTYQQLNEKANQLAHYLKETYALEANDLAGLMMDNSATALVAMLGILKSGAAYVPFDEALPMQRKQFMIEDTNLKVLLIDDTADVEGLNAPTCAVNQVLEDHTLPVENPQISRKLEDLAYVIYTSGSTGQPKGVLISHHNLMDYLGGFAKEAALGEGWSFGLMSTLAADLGHTVLFGSLFTGGTLHLFSKETLKNAIALQHYFKVHPVDCIKIVPSHWRALEVDDQLLLPGKLLVFGGEALDPSYLSRIHTANSELRLINHYGPTETTVGKLMHEVDFTQQYEAIPIGRTFSNAVAYVVDQNMNLCPTGVAGELLIGGAGLCKGYLNREDLNAEKFVDNTFSEKAVNQKLYHTGDLVKRLPNGNIVFLGRVDHQVKVRGYRVELAAIENALEASKEVKQAVVLAIADDNGNNKLVAYVVPKGAFDKAQVQTKLTETLPDYMVPSVFMTLDALPLNANGKIDRKALPSPDLNDLQSKAYAAPRNETEATLAEIWQKLLKIEKVGIYDNFFELGGDSIISIQVVSRAKRAGLKVSPKDVFVNPTIAALSEAITGVATITKAEQDILSGEVALSPIQQIFFEKDFVAKSHFNQCVLLEASKDLNIDDLNKALQALVLQHDALRFVYQKEEGQWKQSYGSQEARLMTIDLSAVAPQKLDQAISNECDAIHRNLNIETGDIFKAVLFKTNKNVEADRLFLVAHHLCVDGISWRIILEHLELAMTALVKGEEIDLGQKSSSYRQWVNSLLDYTVSDVVAQETNYWVSTIGKYQPLPVDQPSRPSLNGRRVNYSISLDAKNTEALLKEVHFGYRTQINDLLLAALLKTFSNWSNQSNLIVGFEGHGREDLFSDLDISNTVGWFTNKYPVNLPMPGSDQSSDLILAVKEALRAVPGKGMGYGLLKYLHPNLTVRNRLAEGKWDVLFNYLGQLDNAMEEEGLFKAANEDTGRAVSEHYPTDEKFVINSYILEGELNLSFSYPTSEYDEATVAQLANQFIDNLSQLLAHCIAVQTQVSGPSDYGLAPEVSYQELDEFLAEKEQGKPRSELVENLYRLGAMQEGILFQDLYDISSTAYVEQSSFDFTEGVDIDALKLAFNYIIQNHSILRTAFFYEALSIPVQCVYKTVEMPVEVVNLSDLPKAEQLQALEELLENDLNRGFDFTQAPLMRAMIIQLEENAFRMIWTHHHILWDGWSSPILVTELLNAYEAFASGNVPEAKEEDKFEDYIRFLANRDAYQEQRFWETYLQDFDTPTMLPEQASSTTEGKGYNILFDEAYTEKIRAFAQNQQITVNTLVQGVWSVLLSAYTGQLDTVFGMVVSGRPSSLQNAEERVGLFINTLPVRSEFAVGQSISSWLSDLQRKQTEARVYQFTPLNKIQKWSAVQGPLFNSLLVFQNYPVGEELKEDWSLNTNTTQEKEQSNYPLSLIAGLGKNMIIKLNYDGGTLSEEFVGQIKTHFEQVLQQIVDNEAKEVAALDLLSEQEKTQLLYEFNNTDFEFPVDDSVVSLFEKQVELHPERIALVAGTQAISYRELNSRANQLAHYLQQQGVQSESMVAICMDRSIEHLVGVLAILKAGGAYVPIDTKYPQNRIDFMLQDIDAQLVLTERKQLAFFENHTQLNCLLLDELEEEIADLSTENLNLTISPDHLVYVIYTSGSTGQPKGVMIEHHSVARLVFNQELDFLNEEAVLYQYAPMAFDASTFEVWGALLKGGKLIIPDPGLKSLEEMASDLKQAQVNTLWLTAGLFHLAVDNCIALFEPLKFILAGGESIRPESVQKLLATYPDLTFINGYGPTESTTFAVVNRIEKEEDVELTVNNIGKPISNTKVYLLHGQTQQLVPFGMVGELCIGGAGLARAYLNNPELTASKFVAHPFESGKRLYKTGDLARWLPNGKIEFLGRKDDQVKVRGFRIELGEIEAVLQQSPIVKQAVVLVKTTKDGTKRLVAYVLPNDSFDKQAILAHLEAELPDYMIPAIFVEMEAFPLNNNGKIDRKVLPEPSLSELTLQQYVAPSNPTEQALADIWSELLHVERVGVEDNFFELGGDSIITIQVVSRAKKLGFHLSPRHVFENPTIKALAVVAQDQNNSIVAEQGVLSGALPLLPIQEWYLQSNYASKSHFNQSFLLNLDKAITENQLAEFLKAILAQHDALRIAFTQTEEGWMQYYTATEAQLAVVDLGDCEVDAQEEAILACCQEYQASLNIEKGELLKMVWIKTNEAANYNRLFIVVHHLAVDGVSWRIILEQLQMTLSDLADGQPVNLGQKSSSYRQWATALEKLALRDQITDQLAYWKSVAAAYEPLPVNREIVKRHASDLDTTTLSLSPELTQALLQDVNSSYGTEINDILLSALVQTICSWSGKEKLLVGLEGHGREDLFADLDISNTVGWFTNLYPVAFELDKDEVEASALIKTVKENLRSVPLKGLGFGLLRYLHEETAVRESLSDAKWDVVFNYLGQFDNVVNSSALFSPAEESTGSSVGPDYPIEHKFSVSCFISDGQLNLSWTYARKEYDTQTVEWLSEQFLNNLAQLIQHCRAVETPQLSPVDYGLAPEVSFRELDTFLNSEFEGELVKDQIEAIYRLSPMQEGMLFHHLLDHQSTAYTEQLTFDFPEGLNIDRFKSSWAEVMKQYSILRTRFIADALNIPVQVVQKSATVPCEIVDYSTLSNTKQKEAIATYLSKDLQRKFDMAQAPLMRIALLKLDDIHYKLVWTFHHIILDGWSLPILLDSLMNTYQSLEEGTVLPVLAEDSYEDYIRYISAKDKYAEADFWKQYLSGLESPSLLPFKENQENETGQSRELNLIFTTETSEALQQYAQKAGLTLSSICQGVWAFLLGYYTNRKDVMYGVTVSGRPTELEKAEQRIGLYINSLPLRAQIDKNLEWTSWLQQLQKTQTQAREYQYTALTDIQNWSDIQGAFFDSILVFENYPIDEALAGHDNMQVAAQEAKDKTNYPLSIIAGMAKQLSIKFNYNTATLQDDYVQMISTQFETVLNQIVEAPEQLLKETQLLSDTAEAQLVQYRDFSKVEYPQAQTIVSLFEKQVAENADHVAVTFEGESLTYQELNERSNQLAHHLIANGLKVEDLVCICLDRSMDMIIGLLAILKAGGAYVPVDPDYPMERINYILDDAQMKFIICDEASQHLFQEREHSHLIVLGQEIAGPVENPDIALQPNNLAYVIYTSGTTGKPKGVLLEHRNVVRLFFNEQALFDFNPQDVWTMFHSFCFDFSVWEMYGALLYGGRVVVVPKAVAKDAQAFTRLLLDEGVTILNQTPSAFYTLLEQMPEDMETLTLRYVIFGGEALNPTLLAGMKAQYPDCKLINMYGITETTVHVTYKEINAEDTLQTTSNIGVPIPTLSAFVLDEKGALLPMGIPGELHVGGAGLARGYLNRETLTKERFAEKQLGNNTVKLYKTGDLVRWLPNGDLEYLGRIDDQVKIRGYRIELGEIEMALQQAPQVKQGVVLAKPDASGQNRLVAYVLSEADLDKNKLKTYLQSKLPEYMVPALIVELEHLPLTSNGKVDKKALPNPDASALLSTAYVPPSNEMEAQLVELWKTLLGVEKVGIRDNFFELGGHSLLATRLMYLIRREFDLEVPLPIFFQYTCIADLAKYIKINKAQVQEDSESFEVMEL